MLPSDAPMTSLPPRADLRATIGRYWRRRFLILIVSGTVFALAVTVALVLPPTYTSGATILIEQQEIPQELVRSAVTSFADQRVQVISQRVMTTQNLLELIERYNLYPDIRASKPREVLLQAMRNDIGMKMISADVIDPRSGRPTQATIAFSVNYNSHSARTGAQGGKRPDFVVPQREFDVAESNGATDLLVLRGGSCAAGGAHSRIG